LHAPLSPNSIRFDDSGAARIQHFSASQEIGDDTFSFGPPKYCAPEAFAFDGKFSCEVADCYVLGFIFYEILVGARAFAAQFATLENGPPTLWLKWHADTIAKARPLNELRPNLGHFARLIDGMMEKDPQKRIGSLSEALREFANVEADTDYKNDRFERRPLRETPGHRTVALSKPAATAPWLNKQSFNEQRQAFIRAIAKLRATTRNMLAASADWPKKPLIDFARALHASQKPQLVALLLVLAAALGISILLAILNPPSGSARLPMSPSSPAASSSASSHPIAARPPVAVPQPASPANFQISAPIPAAPPESELQVDSRVNTTATLSLDDSLPVTLAPRGIFKQKIPPGTHRLRVVAGPKSYLELPLNIEPSGIFVSEPPVFRSLRYVILASNTESARLYASPNTVARVSDGSDEPVPRDGRLIPGGQAVTVGLGERLGSKLRLDPPPEHSIKLVLTSGELALSRLPVEIRTNVPDADIFINGEKFERPLNNGVAVLRLRPGKYRLKLAHPGYQDSAEQDLQINDSDQRLQIHFSLAPVVQQSTLAVSSAPAGTEILVDGNKFKVTDPNGTFSTKVNPGTHTITLQRSNFEDLTLTRDFATGALVNINGQAMKALGKISFHISPAVAQIVCRRQDDSQTQNCVNNQPCLLRAGAYEVTARAPGFQADVGRLVVNSADKEPYERTLEAIPAALHPADLFDDPADWTVDPNGWWSHTQTDYSFLRAKRGTFVFEIFKSSGLFTSNKVSLVVNGDGDKRVLYTLDKHKLYRAEGGSSVEPTLANAYSVPHGLPAGANYRLMLELLPDRIVVRNGAADKVLDSLAFSSSVRKIGFAGKLKLRIIQARFSQ
jgi:serine/threonine protein kinase